MTDLNKRALEIGDWYVKQIADGETDIGGVIAAMAERIAGAENDHVRLNNEKMDHYEVRVAAEAACSQMREALANALKALELAQGKLPFAPKYGHAAARLSAAIIEARQALSSQPSKVAEP